jgi:hypothetical protein
VFSVISQAAAGLGNISRHRKFLLTSQRLWGSYEETGHQLPAGKKMKLVFPAEVTVCDGVMIQLFVEKTDITKTIQLRNAALRC